MGSGVLNNFNNSFPYLERGLSVTFFQIDMKVWGTIAFYFNNHSDIYSLQNNMLTMQSSNKLFYMKQSMTLVTFFLFTTRIIYLKKVVVFFNISILQDLNCYYRYFQTLRPTLWKTPFQILIIWKLLLIFSFFSFPCSIFFISYAGWSSCPM